MAILSKTNLCLSSLLILTTCISWPSSWEREWCHSFFCSDGSPITQCIGKKIPVLFLLIYYLISNVKNMPRNTTKLSATSDFYRKFETVLGLQFFGARLRVQYITMCLSLYLWYYLWMLKETMRIQQQQCNFNIIIIQRINKYTLLRIASRFVKACRLSERSKKFEMTLYLLDK